MTFEVETTQPDKLQITVYETSLDQSDIFRLQEDETYIPKPIFSSSGGNVGISFHVDPERYDLRKTKRTEIFFDKAQKLASNIESNAPKHFKILNNEECCMFAINEPKGLLGIYNTRTGVLNVFAFDEEKENLFHRNNDVQILQWYNNMIPDIRHFFFIKDTEEICFVEAGGRARLYNLVTGQFRPSVGQIPENASVILSTPDGACIVAFVRESIQEKCDKSIENDADVFDNFNHDFNKFTVDDSILEESEKDAETKERKPLGQVKLASSILNKDYSLIQGKRTHFERDVSTGENIVLMGERYCIMEILSDTMLKIAGTFQPDPQCEWMDYRIEPPTKLNGYIDAYKLMFEKYPIDGCIEAEQARPLSLRILLDISREDEIEKYQEKFEKYISDMFEELKRATKKPTLTLKKFATTVELFDDFDADNFKSQRKKSREFQFGEWIIQLSCLIPIQIAVARNNQFHPLQDGMLSTELDQFDITDDYGHHVDSIAQSISFGWYEGIFKYFGSRKVKVVSSMGEQSCGKSYMLNHLVGTTFDGSAMNQFSVNRDMSSMFQRFQDGALLLNDQKLFQASFGTKIIEQFFITIVFEYLANYKNDSIIIKDVPPNDKEDIVREFTLKFNSLVAKEARYENARTFLQNTKVIMAKLRICDWGSLDENLVQIRISTLRRVLQTAVSLGVEQKEPVKEPLINRETGLEIEDPALQASEVFEDYRGSTQLPVDSDILLFEENPDFLRLSRDLLVYFEENIQSRKDSADDSEWFSKLEKYFKYIIERRVFRLHEWFTQNTSKFSQDNSEIVIGRYALEQEIRSAICAVKTVAFTTSVTARKNVPKRLATRTVFIYVNQFDIIVAPLAPYQRSLRRDSINAQTNASFRAKKSMKLTAARTIRAQFRVPFLAAKEGVSLMITSMLHQRFTNEHQCQELCEHPGVCKVQTEPKKNEQTYKGLSGASFTFIKYTQVSEKLQCSRKIPAYSFKHDGKHCHNEDGVHFCDTQCTLEYGHVQTLHETSHGNMVQTEFTAENDEFEYGGHKLKIGDQGTFVLCNLHCKELGRHRHIDYCQNEEICKLNSNQSTDLQHINGRVHPNPDNPKDFISHHFFWEHPYTAQEQQEFTKCDHECPDENHKKASNPLNAMPSKSYCELKLFHAPSDPSLPPPNGCGYISLDGHHFNCENPATREAAFHIVFVLDRSGSMYDTDKRPLQNTPIYNQLVRSHNNRLGAVYNAVYSFIDTRISTFRSNNSFSYNASLTPKDTVSLILFDHEAHVEIEHAPLVDPNQFLSNMLRNTARGGTNFDLAIQKAGFVIDNHFDPTNSTINSTSLEVMAEIAKSYHPKSSASGALKCQFTRAIDEVKLVNHFTGVAESLREHKPALLKKSSV
ncbi:1587_t:CDS:10 [Acaulospora colombiana]|uniref:1587_t:CDS:1 n=1 Tax=Acaulospora colombiana TaxID=27376 RepID=A0ACA9KXT9_9GLOM|nr:1587_t:CDS:10 [Acaulospora colombiana]